MKPFFLPLLASKAGVRYIASRTTLLIAALLLPLVLVADEKYDALYVMSNQATAYLTFKETIEKRKNDSPSRGNHHLFVAIEHLPAAKLKELIYNSRVVITLGQKSTRDMSALNIEKPHIAALITREAYQDILSEQDISRGKHCALVIDQPLDRILCVIRDRLPDARVAGIIENPGVSENTNPPNATQQHNYPQIIRAPLDKNIHSTIRTLSQNGADTIIALHNQKVYNRSTARNILISSYHFNLPLIGYSSAFVKAGALIGIYSTPESMAKDVIDIVDKIDRCFGGNMYHPSEYTVEVNPQVAKSLGINIDTSDLKQKHQGRLQQ